MKRKNTENMTDAEFWDYSLNRACNRNWDRILYDWGHPDNTEPLQEGDSIKVTAANENFWCEVIGYDPETKEYLAIVDNILIGDALGGKAHGLQFGDFLFIRAGQIRTSIRKKENKV